MATFVKSRKTNQPVVGERISWSIYFIETNDAGSTVANYKNITNQEMNGIADMHLIAKWKLEIHKWFNEDLNTMIADTSSRVYPIGDQEKRFIDILDSNNYFKSNDMYY